MSTTINTDRRKLFTGAAMIAAASVLPTSASAQTAAKPMAGKVAFVTGAARGIGRATAEAYARNGANVALIDIANPAALTSTAGYEVATRADLSAAANAVRAHGVRALEFAVDVRDLAALENAARVTAREFGGIDFVFANAGYVAWHPFDQGAEQQWRDVVDVNLIGVWKTMHATIPHLKQRGGGRIIATASIGGRYGVPGNGAYTSTKWAVIGLVKQAAQELGAYNIAVNAVSPGPVDTPMYRSAGQLRSMGLSTRDEQDAVLNPLLPLGDAPALQPSDIADAVLFLSGPQARTISGVALDVALGFNANYSA